MPRARKRTLCEAKSFSHVSILAGSKGRIETSHDVFNLNHCVNGISDCKLRIFCRNCFPGYGDAIFAISKERQPLYYRPNDLAVAHVIRKVKANCGSDNMISHGLK